MNKDVVLEFIASINLHDVDGIVQFISDDHVFIDAQGNLFKGKNRIKLCQVYADYSRLQDIIAKHE
ncbi:MAG: hypothetical protein JSV17_12635 [Candidatus Aminicenantes bacterium]|nr:MAG: hypothetical protein JSV17_12635 [Candidatus Aminicenantes bacterium]